MAKKHYKHRSHGWTTNERSLVVADQVVVRDATSSLAGYLGVVEDVDDRERVIVRVPGAGKMKYPEDKLQLVDPPF